MFSVLKYNGNTKFARRFYRFSFCQNINQLLLNYTAFYLIKNDKSQF